MTNDSPFASWVMSHILSNVMSRNCYNLRIIGHLQQPSQDPVADNITDIYTINHRFTEGFVLNSSSIQRLMLLKLRGSASSEKARHGVTCRDLKRRVIKAKMMTEVITQRGQWWDNNRSVFSLTANSHGRNTNYNASTNWCFIFCDPSP